jgi:hypothetical protein
MYSITELYIYSKNLIQPLLPKNYIHSIFCMIFRLKEGLHDNNSDTKDNTRVSIPPPPKKKKKSYDYDKKKMFTECLFFVGSK